MIGPNISAAALEHHPFDHFLISTGVDMATQAGCLNWLENEAPWELKETDFYEQYEFSLLQCSMPNPIAGFSSTETLATLRFELSRLFGMDFQDEVEVVAHKLVKGQTIRIHNDFIPGAETHRVLVHLNRGWLEEYGGQLMFFSGPEPEHLCKIVPPTSGSVQGFAISPHSHHAVSTVHGGERFTIVYSFFAR